MYNISMVLQRQLFWMWYLRNTLKEFLQGRPNHQLELKDEWIQFRWPEVKLIVTLHQSHVHPCDIFLHMCCKWPLWPKDWLIRSEGSKIRSLRPTEQVFSLQFTQISERIKGRGDDILYTTMSQWSTSLELQNVQQNSLVWLLLSTRWGPIGKTVSTLSDAKVVTLISDVHLQTISLSHRVCILYWCISSHWSWVTINHHCESFLWYTESIPVWALGQTGVLFFHSLSFFTQ